MSTPDPQDQYRPEGEAGQPAPSAYDQWARGDQTSGAANAPDARAPYSAPSGAIPGHPQPPAAHGGSQGPYGQGDHPYGQSQDPYAQAADGQPQHPYAQAGYGQAQDPYAQTGYGQAQDPYAAAAWGQPAAPSPQQPGTYPQPGAYPQSAFPVGGYYPPVVTYPKNGLAVWSLWLGVIGVIGFWALCPFIAAIGSIVTGHLARSAVGRGQANNGRLATWGLVLGYVGLALSAVVFIFSFTRGFIDGWNGV